MASPVDRAYSFDITLKETFMNREQFLAKPEVESFVDWHLFLKQYPDACIGDKGHAYSA